MGRSPNTQQLSIFRKQYGNICLDAIHNKIIELDRGPQSPVTVQQIGDLKRFSSCLQAEWRESLTNKINYLRSTEYTSETVEKVVSLLAIIPLYYPLPSIRIVSTGVPTRAWCTLHWASIRKNDSFSVCICGDQFVICGCNCTSFYHDKFTLDHPESFMGALATFNDRFKKDHDYV